MADTDTSRALRDEASLRYEGGADALARTLEPTDVTELKQRLGISDYISLESSYSLFQWVQEGLTATKHYILGKAQAEELIATMDACAAWLVTTHDQIASMSGTAQKNAKSHWTKLAYRHQKIVKAINESATQTENLFKGRLSVEQAQRLAIEQRDEVGNPYLIAGVVVGVLAIWGVLVMVGAVITSAIKHYAEVKMYTQDMDATLKTGKPVGMVANRATKKDPILGELSEFFGDFNWGIVIGIAVLGAGGLLGYWYLKKKILKGESVFGETEHRKIPKVKGDFPSALLYD